MTAIIYDGEGRDLGRHDVTGHDPSTGNRYLAALAMESGMTVVYYLDADRRWCFYCPGPGGAEGLLEPEFVPFEVEPETNLPLINRVR